jgi:hypothetical protein
MEDGMERRGFIALALAATAWPAAAAANCTGASIEMRPRTLHLSAPFSGEPIADRFPLAIKAGNEACAGELRLRLGAASLPEVNGVLSLSARRNGEPPLVSSERAPAEGTAGSFFLPPSKAKFFDVYAVFRTIDPGRPVRAGDFTFPVDVFVEDAAGRQIKRRRKDVAVRIPKTAQIGAAEAAVPYESGVRTLDVHLGDLTASSVPRRLYVTVRSTAAYRLEFSSSGNRRLRHKGGGAGADEEIPYRIVLVGGVRKGDAARPAENDATSAEGRAHEFRIGIDPNDVRRKRAGKYGDTLTVTVTPAS